MSQPADALTTDAVTEIAEALNQAVAETVVTTMLAQNFHWNVTGMGFGQLHALFQEIYEDHFTAQDDLAERVKALGAHAEGQLGPMVARSKVEEHDGHADDKTMIAALSAAQKTVAQTLTGVADVAERHGDLLTQDLAIERGRTHEKFAWLLDAHLR
jgi:starvation-inducible DNA-binding protein